MAGKRKGVTLENAYDVYNFFERSLKIYPKQGYFLEDTECSTFDMFNALTKVTQYSYCSMSRNESRIPDVQELDNWVINHVAKKGWQACLSDIRQRVHQLKNRNKTVQMPIGSYSHWQLKQMALKYNSNKEFLTELSDTLFLIHQKAQGVDLDVIQYLKKHLDHN